MIFEVADNYESSVKIKKNPKWRNKFQYNNRTYVGCRQIIAILVFQILNQRPFKPLGILTVSQANKKKKSAATNIYGVILNS